MRKSLFLVVSLATCLSVACTRLQPPKAPVSDVMTPVPAQEPRPGEQVSPPKETKEPSLPEQPKQAPPISIIAVGDMMLGTTYPDKAGSWLAANDGANLFEHVGDLLRGADLSFGNLEGPLYDGEGAGKCASVKKKRGAKQTCWAFRMPTRYVKHLVEAGFDIVSIANNHAWDFGKDGRESTKKALDEAGIAHSGESGSVAEFTVKGRKVGLIAFATANHSHNLNDIEAAVAAVTKAEPRYDLLVVSFHGGAEGARHQHVPNGPETFYGEKRGDLRKFSRAVIDAGADLVIGHGPHVVRGMEIYKGHLIAYSLGNYATAKGISVRGPAGVTLALEVRLGAEGELLGGRVHPMFQLHSKGPRPDPEAQVISALQELSNADFGETAVILAADGSFAASPAIEPERD